MVVGDLEMQGVRASVAMILTKLSRNIPVLALEGLNNNRVMNVTPTWPIVFSGLVNQPVLTQGSFIYSAVHMWIKPFEILDVLA